MWIVYLIEHSLTKQIYIGLTNNLKRRLSQHNSHQTKATHRKKGEWVIIYAEAYRSKQDALEREKMLKHHGSSKQKLKLRIKRSLLGG